MMVDATAEPLRLCVELAKRFDTMPLVEHAVAMTRYVMAECERLLDKDADDDGRPEAAEGWTQWWDGLSQKGDIEKLLHKLAMSQQALQLALAAVAVSSLRAPVSRQFRFIPEAMESAKAVLEEFEMGRCKEGWLLAVGCVYEFTQPSAQPSKEENHLWADEGEKRVRLQWNEGLFSLCLENVDTAPDEGEDKKCERIVVPLKVSKHTHT